MSGVQHRSIEVNGIRIHIAEAGEGPLVLLLHGFPESWYSWRHQLNALADAGYHVVAPDQRGYGQTDRPPRSEQYTQLHLVGDVIGLLDALGEKNAVVVGHDWGSIVAWDTALLRPDRVRGIASLSVPYFPRMPVSIRAALHGALGERVYMQYFQEPGVAEAELEQDVRATMRRILYGWSGDAPGNPREPVLPAGGGFLDIVADTERLPGWLTEADLDFYTREFERTGFTGGLNWYRALDLGWELMAPWHMTAVSPPALYVVGDMDVVVALPGADDLIAQMPALVPNLTDSIMLPGCGHWTQQERPSEVNDALIAFLAKL
jgi:pimeloyl-ACP methyl ester carboxylesterase